MQKNDKKNAKSKTATEVKGDGIWSNVPQDTVHIMFLYLPLRSVVNAMTVSKQFLAMSAHFLLSTEIFVGQHKSHNNICLSRNDLILLLQYTGSELNRIRIGKQFMGSDSHNVRNDVLLGGIRSSVIRSSHFKELRLNCTGLNATELIQHLRDVMPRLHTLELAELQMNYGYQLVALLSLCTPNKLKSLTLDRCEPFDKLSEIEDRSEPHHFQRFLAILYTLQSLTLKRCGTELLFHKNRSGRQILIFDFCPFIEHLSISGQMLMLSWGRDLKKKINDRAQRLQTLRIEDSRITLTCDMINGDVSNESLVLFPNLRRISTDANLGFFKSYQEENSNIINFMQDADLIPFFNRLHEIDLIHEPNHQQSITHVVFKWMLQHTTHAHSLSLQDYSELRDDCFSESYVALQNLTALDLSTTQVTDGILVSAIDNLPNLADLTVSYGINRRFSSFREKVVLSGYLQTYQDAINLGMAVHERRKCNLRRINFSYAQISQFALAFIFTAASDSLERVVLKGSFSISAVTCDHIPDLAPLTKLARIKLCDANYLLAGFISQQLIWRKCPALKYLDISRLRNSYNDTMETISLRLNEIIPMCPELTCLKAESITQITDAELQILNDCCPHIRALYLSGTKISLQGLKSLNQISNMTKLKIIGIQMPTDVESVHSFLQLCTNLRFLTISLQQSGINNETLEYIGKYCANIEVLILGGRPQHSNGQFLTKKTFATFLVNQASSLQSLIMDYCPVERQEELEKIKGMIRRTGRSAPNMVLPTIKSTAAPNNSQANCKQM